MAKMRTVQVSRRNGPLEIVERQIPQPLTGTVRIKVEACGICHTDMAVVARRHMRSLSPRRLHRL